MFSLIFCLVFVDHFFNFIFLLGNVVLFVLRFTASDYPLDIFKLFLYLYKQGF